MPTLNFAEMLESVQEPMFGSRGGSRNQLSEEEIRARLAHYESTVEDFEVTEEHFRVMKEIFHNHSNVFITGGAGTGKTSLVRHVIIPELDHRNLNWAVTATTGIAGSHLDGRTIHSFFGIGRGPDWPETVPDPKNNGLPKVVPNPQHMDDSSLQWWYETFFDEWMHDPSIKEQQRKGVISRLRAVEVIILDELSMCHGGGMLGYLDYMLRQLRASERPFGGVQMIFIGDFAQIPPVEERRDIPHPDWAFMSRCWESAKVKTIMLTKIFRQGEGRFIQFLNEVRQGLPIDRDYVRQFVRRDITWEESQNYTYLMPTNEQAKDLNTRALSRYPGPTYSLAAEFCIEPELLRDWERNKISRIEEELVKALRLLDKTLFVRIGTPVMFTVNDPAAGFFNGTRGFVREVNLRPRTGDPPFNDADTITVGVPQKDGTEKLISIGRWPYSRSRREDVRHLTTMWNKEKGTERQTYRYPVIRQFPLIPATAITIHKSQGMSLDRAILDLGRSFAAGQVYVALSRLRSPEGLVLLGENFEALADPDVLSFYKSLGYGDDP